MKIYTKAGDTGATSLRDGLRVPKDDIRVETNGVIDELNASLGVVRSMTEDEVVRDRVKSIQQQLMQVMGRVALSAPPVEDDSLVRMTQEMEQEIDRLAQTGRFRFSIPGDDRRSAFVHVARTVCRKAERRLWTMSREHPVGDDVMRFMNRLSDYLFVLADLS